MGGEVTGTIDESIRHAITKFSHYHFVASKDAAERVLKLGENPASVFNFGCPRMDEVREIIKNFDPNSVDIDGIGDAVKLTEPFLLVAQHPVTTEFEKNGNYME